MQSVANGLEESHLAEGQNMAGRIEAVLRDEVAAGLLASGERLDETRLAARFGTSRTPVREALARLAAHGTLVATPGRGTRVAEVSREALGQMFEAMREIESSCARLVSQRLTLLSRSEIEAAQTECRAAADAADVPRYLRANEAFHATIYRATQNPFMAELASDFRRRTGPSRARRFANVEDLAGSVVGHEALMATMFSQDGQVAYDGMRAHLTESYLRVLAAHGPRPI